MFLGFGLAQLALFVWLVRVYLDTGAKAAAVILFPQFFLIWDNLRVAAGIVLGFGDLLYTLTWPAFWAHWLSGCWLTISSGSILRLAGVEFAKSRWVMGGFCTLATALVIHDLPLFWTKKIYPVCEFDLIRYSSSVTEANRCSADQPLVSSEFPIAPVVTCFVVIGSGLVLWVRKGFPWMAVGGIVMLLTAAVPALNRHRLDNLGEVFITGGSIWAIWYLTRAVARAPRDQAPRDREADQTPPATAHPGG